MATAVGRMPVALLHRRKPQPQQAATQPFKLRPWKASLSKKYHTSLETQCSSLKYCITTQSYKSNLLLSTCNCHHTCSDSSGGISSSSISALFRSNAAAVIDGNVVVNRHFIPFRSPRGDKIATQEREHFAPRSHHGNIISSTQYEEPAPGRSKTPITISLWYSTIITHDMWHRQQRHLSPNSWRSRARLHMSFHKKQHFADIVHIREGSISKSWTRKQKRLIKKADQKFAF